MEEWDKSNQNPMVLSRLSGVYNTENDGEKCHELDHDNSKKPWMDKFIIGQLNPVYIAFNIFICILCIASSYYYASFIGFRYTYNPEIGRKKMITSMIVFETFFFIHFLL